MALSGHRRTPRRHHGQRRELLLAAMLQPHAAAWQTCKACSKAAPDSHLPPTECSLRSGCTVDERHGAGTHTSTLRGRRRAIRLTWVSLSVGKHGATVPSSSARAASRQPPAWRHCCKTLAVGYTCCLHRLSVVVGLWPVPWSTTFFRGLGRSGTLAVDMAAVIGTQRRVHS